MERQKMRQIGTMKKEFFPETRKDMWVLQWKDFIFLGKTWDEAMKKGLKKEKELEHEKTSSHRKEFN